MSRKAAVVALLAIAGWSNTASAAVDPVAVITSQEDPLAAPVLGEGWRSYPAAEPLRVPQYRVVEGIERGPGDCEFESTVKATRAAPTRETRVRALHLASCRELLETGRLSAAEEHAAIHGEQPGIEICWPPGDLDCERYEVDPTAREGEPAESSEAPSGSSTDPVTDPESEPVVVPGASAGADALGNCQVPCGTDGQAQRGRLRSASGYYKAYYQEPLKIDVTTVQTYLSWSYYQQPGCTQSYSGFAHYDQYAPTGWSRTNQHSVGGRDCGHAWQSTYAKFKNPFFCRAVTRNPFVGTTYTYFDRSVIRGYVTGSVTGNTRHYAKGGCSSLLVFRSRAVKTT